MLSFRAAWTHRVRALTADPRTIYTVILAGGRASRLGGRQKALVDLGDKPLIEHVIQRWRSLNLSDDQLAINANLEADQLEGFGLPVFPDRDAEARGPLPGVWSSLRWVREQAPACKHLLILPCDSPFFPLDLVDQLKLVDSRKIAVASYQGHLQPTFSLWPVSLLEAVENAIFALDMHGFMEFLDVHPHQPIEWPKTRLNPFFNINTSDDLQQAEQRL